MVETKENLETFQDILERLGVFSNKEIQTSVITESIIRDSEISISDTDGGNVFNVIKTGRDAGDVLIGDYAGGQGIKWDQSAGTLTIKGGLSAGFLDIPDTTTANSFHVETDGDTFWGTTNALFTADVNNAVAYILKTGVARFTSVTLSNSVALSGLIAGTELAIQGWQFDSVFSVSDLDTVAWGAGTLRFLDGSSYSISAGNTGNMSAITYIYFDKAVSQTVLQTTTTASTAVGANKVLICVAENGAVEPTFQVFGGKGGLNINASSIVAGSITANEIAANTITANKMNVSSLSAISANIGAITSGTITLDTAGYIRGGQTDYNTGTGFFLGYSGSAYKFSIGSTTQFLTWDGTNLAMTGAINKRAGTILYQSADTSRTEAGGAYNLKKAITVYQPGTYRVKFTLWSGNANPTAYGKIYVNGSPVGTERTNATGTPTEFSEDISGINSGDVIQLYLKLDGTCTGATCSNFRLYVSQYDYSVVTTD